MRTVAVIGAGHNGLVAAIELARAGHEVMVFEQADSAGGCVWTETHPSGAVLERGAFEHGGIVPTARALGLDEFGLRYREHPLLAGFVFGGGVTRRVAVDMDETAAGLGDDAAGYRVLAGSAATLWAMLDQFPTPPTPTEAAAALANVPGGDDLFRSLLRPAENVIASAVHDPWTRAALELYAAHSQVPPWAPGSGMFAFALPAMHGTTAARPEGGSSALTDALVGALAAAGGVVETGVPVTGLRDHHGRALVRLADGREIAADTVISSIDMRRTADLLDAPGPLAAGAAALHSGHFNVSELTIALISSGRYRIEQIESDRYAVWFVQDRPGDLRAGFGDLLAGRSPDRPWAMLGEVDQPGGHGVLWLSSVVPARPAAGPWTPAGERAAAERVIRAVEHVLGCDLFGRTDEIVVTGPLGWAERIGGDGNPNHLDLTIDQLLGWRPPHHADLRTTHPWLFLCGAGQHPGGGLSGASGRRVAATVLGRSDRRAGELAGLWRAWQAYRAMRRRT